MPLTVTDTNCLIQLARLNLLDLLVELYGDVWTTPEVLAEWSIVPPDWLRIAVPLHRPHFSVALDPGEASALALALEQAATLVLTDGKAARKVANELGIESQGTLGVLLDAKEAHLLPAIAPLVEQLRQSGMYLSAKLVAQVLAEAGE